MTKLCKQNSSSESRKRRPQAFLYININVFIAVSISLIVNIEKETPAQQVHGFGGTILSRVKFFSLWQSGKKKSPLSVALLNAKQLLPTGTA